MVQANNGQFGILFRKHKLKQLTFWKTEALGNDFVLVHGGDIPAGISLSDLAIRVCARRFGIGADGLLVLQDHTLQMFNPDGSEDFCGNGLRCAAVHAFHQSWIKKSDTMIHHGQSVSIQITGDNSSRVVIPGATFEPHLVPHTIQEEIFESEFVIDGTKLILSSLSTGSTHSVVFVDELPSDDIFLPISRALENDPRFPERTSLMWAMPITERHIKLRIWERGAGETLGCGTGSAAVAVTWSRKTGLTGDFTIENPGGTVIASLSRWQSPIALESDVVETFTGELNYEEIVLPDSVLATSL